MSRLNQLVQFIREAGSPRESSHERNSAFSYKSETHAAGMGFAAGFIAGATGETRLIGVVVGIAVYANRGDSVLQARVVNDLRAEPHYALGAIPLGYVVGTAVSGVGVAL